MARAQGIDDLFGHVPQAGELDLPKVADEPEIRMHVVGGYAMQPAHGGESKETIRIKLTGLVEFIRGHQTLPWDAYELRYFTGISCYWAEWLKNGEGDALLADLKAEMDRLEAPAELVAPNWRRIWGIEV
jgi:hypothetical protein